jgi:hypothetical protein
MFLFDELQGYLQGKAGGNIKSKHLKRSSQARHVLATAADFNDSALLGVFAIFAAVLLVVADHAITGHVPTLLCILGHTTTPRLEVRSIF